jgi:hypothetical protein
MSDLSESVARPHRAAHRNYAHLPEPKKESMTKQDDTRPKKISRPKPTRPAGKQRDRIEGPGQGLKQTDIVAFNHHAEHAFVALITGILQEDGKLSYREAVREAAYELGVSIETAKRYLEKHSARRAEFCIDDGSVTLRRK